MALRWARRGVFVFPCTLDGRPVAHRQCGTAPRCLSQSPPPAALLEPLIELLQKQDDEELTAAFTEWVTQVLLPRRFRGSVSGPLPRLEEVRAMLAETVHEWTAEWVEQGREEGREEGRGQGIEQGREQGQRALLCRQAARKFDAAAAQRLAAALEDVADPDRLAQVGDWIIECDTAADLFGRLSDWSA